jgi:hypothetical protein
MAIISLIAFIIGEVISSSEAIISLIAFINSFSLCSGSLSKSFSK